MRRALFLIAFWSSLLSLVGQSGVDPMASRHALIDSIYNLEDYPRVVALVELQVENSLETEWQDSLYLYMYTYGRALWKTMGQEKGLKKAEVFRERLQLLDEDPEHMLSAYTDLSWLHYDAGDMKSCFRVDSTALDFARAHPEIPKEKLAKQVTYMGFDSRSLGDNLACIEWYREAVEIFQTIDYHYEGRELDHAAAYNALAACQWHSGFNEKAGKNYRKALEQLEGRDDTRSISFRASTLGNMAILYEDMGDYATSRYYFQENISSCQRAIREFESPKDKEEMMYVLSKTYSNLAATYFDAGQLDLSKEYLDRAWEMRSEVFEEGDSRLEFLNNQRSVLEVALGNYQKADRLSTRYVNSCIRDYGLTGEYTINGLMELASIKAFEDNYPAADSLFTLILSDAETIKNSKDSPWLGLVYLRKGELRFDQERYEEALILMDQALSIYRRVFAESQSRVQQATLIKVQILVELGRLEEANEIVDNVISVLTEKRSSKRLNEVENDQRPEVLPMAYAARAQILSLDPEQLELAMKELHLAMGIIDQDYRAMRGANATLYYTGKVSEIFDQAQSLKYRLGAESQAMEEISQVLSIGELNKTVLLKSRLNSFESISYGGIPDSILKQEQVIVDRLGQGLLGDGMSLDETQNAYRDLIEKLRTEYPKYFELKYGEHEVQLRDIQDHLLSDGQTILSYTMHDDGVIVVMVDPIEAKMLQLKIDSLPKKIEQLGKVTMSMDQEAFEQSARLLYDELFAPVKEFIKGKEVIIIPDDELYLLNFELLVAPVGGEVDAGLPHFLIYDYTVSYLLSASTALQFERLGGDRGTGTLALAPGFSDQMKSEYQARISDTLHLDQTYLRLIKQPFAVSTAQGLGKVLSAKVLTGAEANEKRFKAEAEQYGVIHLGTHTEVNDVSPLFSKLFLSKSDSIDEDGYLHAYEIYDMELKAELAVLTACETGTGRKAKAEGLRSLAHGFAYAGCPSLVMSLWKIDEKTSAEITDSFYEYLSQGQAKNIALSSAKLDFIKDNPELRAPYYWAGIVLMGDVSPIQVATSFNWLYFIGAILLLLLLFVLYRRFS